jgi:N-methylhydantoinase A/oxoprolinase/acetone carboxylase beta subunit
VTDANLWLGRLLPDFFLGGRMSLHPDATHQAVARLAQDFAVSPADLALSIIRAANSTMAKALRAVSLERGYDPRNFTLVCFGGAGGLHVCELARELDISRIIIPAQAGVFSALGMAAARPRRDLARTVLLAAENVTWDNVAREVEALKNQALKELARDGFAVADLKVSLDLRYIGQSYSLNVPWSRDFVEMFHNRHRHTYGHAFPTYPVEATTIRLQCQGENRGPVEQDALPYKAAASITLPDTAMVWLVTGRTKTPIWYRPSLTPGFVFQGPALIVENTATTLVLPEFDGRVDDLGHIHLQVMKEAKSSGGSPEAEGGGAKIART